MTMITVRPSVATVPSAAEESAGQRTRVCTALLLSGIVSALLYVGINFLGALQFPGCTLISQTFSERSRSTRRRHASSFRLREGAHNARQRWPGDELGPATAGVMPVRALRTDPAPGSPSHLRPSGPRRRLRRYSGGKGPRLLQEATAMSRCHRRRWKPTLRR